MKKNLNKQRPLIFCFLLLTASTFAKESLLPFNAARQIVYQPILLKPPLPSFSLQTGNDSALEKAYHTYLKTGKAPNIITEGFVAFAYGAQQPIVPASPFELSVITLEAGEWVTNVSSGDPMRWSYSLAYSGKEKRRAHVMVKPALPNISTDLVIMTDKRFYTIKLVSRQSPHYFRDVRFWYPEDLQQSLNQASNTKRNQLMEGAPLNESDNAIDPRHLNFDYKIRAPFFSQQPSWTPIRIFDDGRHTFIEFNDQMKKANLPALFVQCHHQMQMANYRFNAPYFVIDQVFSKALLISGAGKHQASLTLINQKA